MCTYRHIHNTKITCMRIIFPMVSLKAFGVMFGSVAQILKSQLGLVWFLEWNRLKQYLSTCLKMPAWSKPIKHMMPESDEQVQREVEEFGKLQLLSWHLQCTAEGSTDAWLTVSMVHRNDLGGSWEEGELSHIGAYYMSYIHNWSAHGPLQGRRIYQETPRLVTW